MLGDHVHTRILSDSEIETICKTPKACLTNVEQLKSRLGASSDWVEEWAQKVVDEIHTFDVVTV
jgi:hypothetical protein